VAAAVETSGERHRPQMRAFPTSRSTLS
jgi:hypothetical protein